MRLNWTLNPQRVEKAIYGSVFYIVPMNNIVQNAMRIRLFDLFMSKHNYFFKNILQFVILCVDLQTKININ